MDIDQTNKELLDMKAKMEDNKKAKEMLSKQLQEQEVKAVESIKQFRSEMNELLKTLENESMRNLEEKYKILKDRIEDDINKLQELIDELKLSSQKLAKSSGNKAQQFVSVKKAMKKITEVKKEGTSLTNVSNFEIVFTADSKMKDVLMDFKAFGLVSVNETKRVRNKLYEVKSKKQINIKHQNDRCICNVHGACFTDDGLLLLSDLNNKALKLVDVSSESVKDQLIFDWSPHAVCQTGKNEIAVSLTNKTIQIISLDDKIKVIKQLQMDHYCFGMAYSNGKLFISDQSKSLYIHNMNGNLICKVKTDKQGLEIFHGNRHISVSSGRKMIYVADFIKGIIVFDLEGNYNTTITDPDICNLWGVCTDREGSIFVCGWGESKLVQINEGTGANLGVLGNGTNCVSTCFDSKQNRLVVTICKSNLIELYELF